jgi:hypothetical protein
MLTLIVPMIALVLVTGTIYALSGAVGQMMAPAAAAAQRFGGESGVGNMNMGNVRYDTFAARTHNASTYQSSGSVDAGGMSVAAPTNKHTSAYGSTEQAAGQPGAAVVAKTNVSNLGAWLAQPRARPMHQPARRPTLSGTRRTFRVGLVKRLEKASVSTQAAVSTGKAERIG